MNILCLDQFSELGGAQRCLLDLLPAIVERGWQAHVAAPGDGELLAGARALGATADQIHCGPYTSGRKTLIDAARFAVETPRLAGEIRALIRRHDADLLYVNGPRVLPAAALANMPVLFHCHSYLAGAARRLAGWSLRRAQASVVASCRFVAEPLGPYARGIKVVYNGVRPCLYPRRRGAGMRIGVIGRIAPEKGQADFLRAARLVYPDLPDARFLIYGAPLFASAAAIAYSTGLQALAKDLPVEFAGWTQNVDEVLATLDLLVVPSTAIDATPRVILEAFAAGVPVVAFAAGGIPEMIEHNVTGFLVRESSPEALAAALREVLRGEPERLCEMAERARIKALSDFSLERYREQMMEALNTAAGQARLNRNRGATESRR